MSRFNEILEDASSRVALWPEWRKSEALKESERNLSMPKLTIKIAETNVTVSDMRKQFAQILSSLRGDQKVSFSFSAVIEKYTSLRSGQVIDVTESEMVQIQNGVSIESVLEVRDAKS
jgi:hypothetical protein